MKHRRGINFTQESSAVPAVERRLSRAAWGALTRWRAYVLLQHVDIEAYAGPAPYDDPPGA